MHDGSSCGCRGTVLQTPGKQTDYLMVMLKGEALVRTSQSRGGTRTENRQIGELVAPSQDVLSHNNSAVCTKDSIVIYMPKVRFCYMQPASTSCS